MVPLGDPADHISRIFGGRNTPSFLEALGEVETEADVLSGDARPLHFNIAPLRRDDRYRLQNQIRDAARLDEVTASLSDQMGEFRPNENDRPFAAINAPAGDTTSAEEMFYRAQSFRVDEAVEVEQGRYDLTGRQLRPSVLQRHADMINEGLPSAASRMIFDVETTGTGPSAQVWQLAGRFTDEGGQTESFNFLFDAEQMQMGDFADTEGNAPRLDQQLSPRAGFEEYYRAARDPQARFLQGDEAAQGVRRFLKMSEQAEQWVGHNVTFDIDMMTRQMERIMGIHGTDEDMQRVRRFTQQATERAVDTHLLAAHHLGGIEADEAANFQRLSMDNILLRTSLFEDIEARLGAEHTDEFVTDDVLQRAGGHGGRAAILGRLETGTHFGDIDVFFEEHLLDLFEERSQGREALRTLTTEEAVGQGNVSALRGRYRELIGAPTAGSITPMTKLFQHGNEAITPMQQQVLNTRQITGEVSGTVNQERILRAAQFGDWVEKTSDPQGPGLGAGSRNLPRVQGLPFEGLSAPERLVSGLLGRHTANVGSDRVAQAREVIGEALGTGVFRQRTQGAQVYGRGRVAALPTELLAQAEQEGVIGTEYTKAARGEARQTPFARLSTIDYNRGGQQINDIALVGDIGKQDAANLAEYIRNLDTERRQQFGLETDAKLERIAGTVETYGSQHGIQLGILGDDDPTTNERLVKSLKDVGADVDTGPHRFRVPIMQSTPVAEEPRWMTGPAVMDVPGQQIPEEQISRELQALETVQQEATSELENRRLRHGTRVARQGGAEGVQRVLRALDTVTPGRLAAGLGVVAGGALLYNRAKTSDEREIINEPFEEQPIQPGTEGRPGMQPIPPERASPRYSRLSRHDNTGVPSALHRTRTRHHEMNNRQQRHLYG